ncbi:MAG: hypothetical protein IPN17_37885 [Deltaproteobacteria bacterium]|nr:hypothetical protein [Deltaproteobacteria bacterium]
MLADAAGIFAFALYDREQRRLTLARDPMGVKQLYLHDDGRRVVFASEIKALLECPDVPRRLDPDGPQRVPPLPHPPLRAHLPRRHEAGARRGVCDLYASRAQGAALLGRRRFHARGAAPPRATSRP